MVPGAAPMGAPPGMFASSAPSGFSAAPSGFSAMPGERWGRARSRA